MTADFVPARASFHLLPTHPDGGRAGEPIEVQLADLKALFFVKDFTGNPAHAEAKEFEPGVTLPGRRIRVEFLDGEVLGAPRWGISPTVQASS
jgi:hypothetical protein